MVDGVWQQAPCGGAGRGRLIKVRRLIETNRANDGGVNDSGNRFPIRDIVEVVGDGKAPCIPTAKYAQSVCPIPRYRHLMSHRGLLPCRTPFPTVHDRNQAVVYMHACP